MFGRSKIELALYLQCTSKSAQILDYWYDILLIGTYINNQSVHSAPSPIMLIYEEQGKKILVYKPSYD